MLSKYTSLFAQDLTIGLFILLVLLPAVCFSSKSLFVLAFSKQSDSISTSPIHKINQFCYNIKPTNNVEPSMANGWILFGFLFEWFVHILYTLPGDVVVSGGSQLRLISSYPPYLDFTVIQIENKKREEKTHF